MKRCPPTPWRGRAAATIWRAVVAVLATSCVGAAAAQSPAQIKAGQEKSRSCMVCHGQVGISNLPNAPHLAGQPAIYLAEQLKAYRSGKRANEVMAVIARALSDADIDDLSAWYAAIRIDATAPN